MGFKPDAIDLQDYDNAREDEYILFQWDNCQFTFQNIDKPGAFTSPTDYSNFLDALWNKCANTPGGHGFGIDYLFHKDKHQPSETDLSTAQDQKQFLWHAPHSGAHFKNDSKQLWSILAASLQESSVWDTIKSLSRKKDGDGALVQINKSMLGMGAVQNQISFAQAELKNLKYSDEQTFSFTSYCNEMVGHFDMLDNADCGYKPLAKVKKLLDSIQNITNAAIKQIINTVKSDYPNKFFSAYNKLHAVISRKFACKGASSKRKVASAKSLKNKKRK